ncbi:hypothetical protein HYV85_03225 [Candidatus Woesearchaeota archaeon]|nr:hypothetical protein [Candidatus Woesearchaeota archaeon]
MDNAIASSVDEAVIEMSADALLHVALRSGSPFQTIHYAMEAAAAYSLAAEALNQKGSGKASITAKLNAASKLENMARQHLLEKGTEAAMVQYVLAHQDGSASATYLSRIRNPKKSGDAALALSDLVDLQQPPDKEHDIAAIATLALEAEGSVPEITRYGGMAQYYGGLPVEEYRAYLQLLRKTNDHLNALFPLYAQISTEEPTAAEKVSTLLGPKMAELAQLQSRIGQVLATT